MEKLRHWYYPTSLDEALAYLRDPALRAAAIAGGTAFAEALPRDVGAFVDITRLGLAGITVEADGSVGIGATTTAQDLLRAASSGRLPPVPACLLGAAARNLASRLIRNVVTVGGNVVQLYPWSDLPPALLALDADFVFESAASPPRVVSGTHLFEQHPRSAIVPGELLTRVRIPAFPEASGGAFVKFARTAVDHTFCDVATRVDLGPDGRCERARIVVSAVVARPTRLVPAEDLLVGSDLTPERVGAAARAARDLVTPVPDYRASAEYRRELLGTLVERCLEDAARNAASRQRRDGT